MLFICLTLNSRKLNLSRRKTMLSTCSASKRRLSLIVIFLLKHLQPVSLLCVDQDFETGFDALIRPRVYQAEMKRFRYSQENSRNHRAYRRGLDGNGGIYPKTRRWNEIDRQLSFTGSPNKHTHNTETSCKTATFLWPKQMVSHLLI